MAPELLIAANAQRPGWNREEVRRQLMHENPMLIVAEIDKLLDAIQHNQANSASK